MTKGIRFQDLGKYLEKEPSFKSLTADFCRSNLNWAGLEHDFKPYCSALLRDTLAEDSFDQNGLEPVAEFLTQTLLRNKDYLMESIDRTLETRDFKDPDHQSRIDKVTYRDIMLRQLILCFAEIIKVREQLTLSKESLDDENCDDLFKSMIDIIADQILPVEEVAEPS